MYSEQTQMDYRRVEKAISYIRENRQDQPSLEEVAAHVHLSPYHFQRLFSRWAGISPKKFLQFLTLRYAREQLEKNHSLSRIADDVGLSGTGRLHDLFISLEGMTPDQYRKSGSGVTIYHGFHFSPFGEYLLAVTSGDHICWLQFVEDRDSALEEMGLHWKRSLLVPSPERTLPIASKLFRPEASDPVHLLVRGTPFQLKVWEALLKIPFGEVVSYQVVARHVDNPKGLQAVGGAVGKNPVAYLIPCHRVIKKAGQISDYRWGAHRKSAILGWEAASLSRSGSI